MTRNKAVPNTPSVNNGKSAEKTMTEYLARQGLKSIDLESRPNDTVRSILRVQGGHRYEIGDVIAEGGMGKIYEARDMNCRRTVAMKVLTPAGREEREELLRFIEEAQITAQLEHPNIVTVHEVGLDTQERIYYTMKRVQGITLTDVLVGIRMEQEDVLEQFPLSRLLNIFQKICDAVAYAHHMNVVHRDLKPDNIMIGDFGEVVVMDWGLAKILGQHDALSHRMPVGEHDQKMDIKVTSIRADKIGTDLKTISGRVMGTPGFMAPEQARGGEGEVDVRSDIYSLGAILYSLLTLRSSVRGEDINEVLRKIIVGDIIPPAALNNRPDEVDGRPPHFPHCPGGQVPSALSDITLKAMACDPDERYASVQQLQAAIEAYQAGEIWQLVIEEDFTAPGFLKRWQIIGGEYEWNNGELHMWGGEPQMLMLNGDLAGDVRVEFDCHQEGVYLNSVGCFTTAIPPGPGRDLPTGGYAFLYGGYDNSLNVLMRADQKLWSTSASPLVRSEPLHVVAERVGNRLRMIVNDEEIFSVIEPDPLSGSDRTAVGLFGWIADTYYSHIRIYSLGTPWECDVLEMADRQLQKGRYVVAMGLYQEIMDSFPDPDRRQRAHAGYEAAMHRENMCRNLPLWRSRLEQAWPEARINLQMENAGLSLDIANNRIDDLTPLEGMPITTLHCSCNRINSLEPLRGMPLTSLNCNGNPVESLEPLRGMQLTQLSCESCCLQSLEPLRGMPMSLLNCGGNNSLDTGLAPLEGMELTFLSCWCNGIEDLAPLCGMPLTGLYCGGNRIRDLSPLRGMPLNMMHCGGNCINDLEPLRGMQLTSLYCGDNRISSLEPLRGMLLNMFSCQHNQIESLDPLKHMPLASLTCGANRITSIASLIQHPPDIFFFACDSIATAELEWIHRKWVRDFRFELHAEQAETLLALRRGHPAEFQSMAHEFQGNRYLFVPLFMPWEQARDYCTNLGGHLLTVHSQEEEDFIADMFPSGSWFWIGLFRDEKGLHWVNNEPIDYNGFIDAFQAYKSGPKVYSGGWCSEDIPHAYNCFMIKWSLGSKPGRMSDTTRRSNAAV